MQQNVLRSTCEYLRRCLSEKITTLTNDVELNLQHKNLEHI